MVFAGVRKIERVRGNVTRESVKERVEEEREREEGDVVGKRNDGERVCRTKGFREGAGERYPKGPERERERESVRGGESNE